MATYFVNKLYFKKKIKFAHLCYRSIKEMTDQIKFIVREVNAAMTRNYDLIKFDALNEKQLLQLLADLLANFGAGERVCTTHFVW